MKKLSLVLSGGASKGFAHLGVLQVLEENGIKPSLIVGTSMGALVGGIYSTGKPFDEILTLAQNFGGLGHFSLFASLFRGYMLKTKRVEDFLKNLLGNLTHKDCQIPFVAIATDLKTGKQANLDTGLLRDNIRASISIPGVFKTKVIDGVEYVDGGLSNNMAEDVAYELAPDSVIISVDAIGDYATQKETVKIKSLENILNASTILTQNIVKLKPHYASLNIVVSQPDISQFDFKKDKIKKSIEYGRQQGLKYVEQIKKLLKGNTNEDIKKPKTKSKAN